MSDHLPECHLFLEPMLSAQDWCTCDRLRAVEQRSRVIGYALGQADMRRYLLADDTHSFTYGRRDGLDAAREAVDLIPALYKIRGDFETYGPYAEGKADMKDAALSAIDALREKQ
jgi:hypothetical protein